MHRWTSFSRALFRAVALVVWLLPAALPAFALGAPSVTAIDGVCDVRDGGWVTCGPTFPDGSRGTGVPHAKLTAEQLDQRTVVRGISDAVQVADDLDANARCAIRVAGTVSCWGTNAYGGPLSYAGNGEVTEPVAVPGVAGATDLSVDDHACAVANGGAVRCWGDDGAGESSGLPPAPGESSRPRVTTPTTVPGVPPAREVATGHALTCIAAVNGTVWCWGRNTHGALGTGSQHGVDDASAPVQVPGIADATAVDVAGSKVCVIRGAGEAWCWGRFGWRAPELTPQEVVARDYAAPQRVQGATDAVDVSVGLSAACARQRSGHVRCWGDNSLGQLGALARRSSAALEVRGLSDATDLSLTRDTACVLRRTGATACWGADASVRALNAADRATTSDSNVLARVSGVAELGVGAQHWCVVLTTREARCVGVDMAGPREELIGFDGSAAAPTPMADLSAVDELATGENYSCFLVPGAKVRCSGGGNTVDTPVQTWNTGGAGDLDDVVDLSGGRAHVCALRSDGTVWCWGSNSVGQAAGGPPGSGPLNGAAKRPTTGVLDLLAVGDRTCARKASGVVCWGASSGPGGVDSTSDTQVDLAAAATGLLTIAGRTCASHASGQPTCWGPAASSFATAVTCTLEAGEVRCAGDGEGGLLGVGSERFTRWRSVPVDQTDEAIVVPQLSTGSPIENDESAPATTPAGPVTETPKPRVAVPPPQAREVRSTLRSAKASRNGRTVSVRLVIDGGSTGCTGTVRTTVRMKKRAFSGKGRLTNSSGLCRATVKVKIARGLRGALVVRWSAAGLSGTLNVRR